MSRQSSRKGKRCCRKNIPCTVLLRCEWEQFNRRAMLIGGCAALAAALACRIAIGSPLRVRHLFVLSGCMPSTLCLYVFGGGLLFCLGTLFGGLAAAPSPAILRARFRGTALLVPLMLFSLLWYPLLFGALSPALALISLLTAVFCAVCALAALRRLSHLAPLLLVIDLLWLLRLLCATLWVILRN